MVDTADKAPIRDFISSLLLAGYRSFGSEAQRFRRLSTINLFIGPNNSGKSALPRKYTLHNRC
jgi:predicted ATPase